MRIFQAKIGLFPCKIRFDRRQQENNFKSCTKNFGKRDQGKRDVEVAHPTHSTQKISLACRACQFYLNIHKYVFIRLS